MMFLAGGPIPAQVTRANDNRIPQLEVDTSWPHPLPNMWAVGGVSGIAVGAQDHIWILHRPATLGPDEKLAAELLPTRPGDAAR